MGMFGVYRLCGWCMSVEFLLSASVVSFIGSVAPLLLRFISGVKTEKDDRSVKIKIDDLVISMDKLDSSDVKIILNRFEKNIESGNKPRQSEDR